MVDFRPKLLESVTPEERITALCEFMEFWLGKRDDSFGEAPERVYARALPRPLSRLYAFAGKWPSVDGPKELEYTVPAFSRQDCLLSLNHLRTTDDGKIIFLDENQSVWNCRTLPEGNDPPVWCDGDQMDENRSFFSGERIVCDSLSCFLVTFVLQELTFGARLCLCDEGLDQLFERDLSESIPVWTRGPYVHGSDHAFFLWGSVLVARFGDGYWHSANSDAGIDFLTKHQGPINRIGMLVGTSWDLDINCDGSARCRHLGETAEAPAGTFDFEEQLGTLSILLSGNGDFFQNAMVYFRRKGQRSGTTAKHVHDSQYARSLFKTVLDHAVKRNPVLEQQFATGLFL